MSTVRQIASEIADLRYEAARKGRAFSLCPGNSDINLFGYGQSIINFGADDRALDFGVPPSLSNAATIYPRFAAKKNKVITLEDQIQNCVAGALRGKPPAYGSEQMTQLVVYITSLAQGKPLNLGGNPD